MTAAGAATGTPGVGGAGGAGGAGGNVFGDGGRGGDGGFSFTISGAADGIDVVAGSTLRATAGDIVLRGTSGTGAGAAVAGAPGPGGAGGGGTTGVDGAPGTTPTVSGAQLGGDGMRLINATLAAANVRLTGLAQEATAPSFAQRGVSGIVSGSATVTASQGVDIRGVGSAGSGINMGFGDVVTSAGAPLMLTGDTSSASARGLSIGPATLGGAAQTADIILRARNGGAADSIDFFSSGDGLFIGSVRTSGTLVVTPGGLSADGTAIVAANAVPLNLGTSGAGGLELDPLDLAAMGQVTGTLVVGSSTHTGAIQVGTLGALPFSLSLQNEGPGAAGINLQAGLSATGRTVALATGGPLVSAGAITADALQVRGAAGTVVNLANPGNAVNTLAVDPPASFSFVNSGPLRLGPVSASGFSTATGTVGTTTVANSSSLGDFTVQTAGSITLDQNISLVNPGSNITLAAATLFNNAGAGTLTPGAGGRWRIWADTWIGENRGGLAPTTPNPNFYGCTFGAASCASGVTIPDAGNHFIYVQQPTATLTAIDQTRLYGGANPTPAFAAPAGLVNGDTAGDAFVGSLAHTALIGSPVGLYDIVTTSLASPVGYRLIYAPGTLDVTPAPLTIRADDVTKVFGDPVPPLSRTVTGLVLGETDSVISGGVPVTTATPSTPVAVRPAITLTSASATNYAITTVPGVMTVTRAPLTVVADDKLRLEGAANPPLTATLTGLVAGDTSALVESAGLRLTTRAGLLSPAGAYLIDPGALILDNYSVTLVSGTLIVVGNGGFERPMREIRSQSTDLYERNQGLPAMCTASDASVLERAVQGSDLLSIEWSRVRQKPNLSNCLDLGQRNGCSDF
jgi:hypothetical protein